MQVTLEEGALVELLSVAVHSVRLANATFGTSILILGPGAIGLLCCAVARASGQSISLQLTLSLLGCNLEGADVVIDATGAKACIDTGIYAMKRGGTILQAGLGAPHIQFPVAQLCSKEGNYRGSFRYGTGGYSTAIGIVACGSVSLKGLITHKSQFDDDASAFESVEQRQGINTIIYGPGIGLGDDPIA